MALFSLRSAWRRLPIKLRYFLAFKLGLLRIISNGLTLKIINTFRYNILVRRQNIQPESKKLSNQEILIKFIVNCEYAPAIKKTIDSLNQQHYQHWKIYIISNDTPNSNFIKLIRSSEKILLIDNINNIITNKPCLVSNLIPGQVFSKNALESIITVFTKHKETQAIYTDDDFYTYFNLRCNHNLKPEWNETYFFNFDYIGNSVFFSNNVLAESSNGSFTPYKSILNCDFSKIKHIPKPIISYPKKQKHKTHTDLASQSEHLNEHFKKNKINAEIHQSNRKIDIKYDLKHKPLATIIIPTRDATNLLKQCIESILKNTNYKNYEIFIINNQSSDPDFFRYINSIECQENITCLDYNAEFNYSAMNNYAVQKANGEIIILLNNDIEIVSPNWLEKLIAHTLIKNTGCVGAKLIYPNGNIQHAGIIVGLGGVAGHLFKGESGTSHGYQNRLICDQNYSAVTAACLAIRKNTFLEIGGFDEKNLKVAFNDVDLCLKAIKLGYTNKCLLDVDIIHHESATRGLDTTPKKLARFEKEIEFMKKKWATEFYIDPSSNPNFSKNSERLMIKRS